MSYQCAKCRGRNVITNVRVVDRTLEEDWMPASGNLAIEVATKPRARIFKGVTRCPLHATVCGTCGYTELFVSDPDAIVEARDKRTQNLERLDW